MRALLAVLVIAPCRRRSPLELSLGVSPRNGPSDCGRNRCQSPSSTVNANAVSVETPRRQTSRSTTSSVRLARGELGDRFVERVSSGLRVEHPAVALVEHDRERPALEPLPAKPRVVRPRPGGRVVHRPVTEQQLREPMPGAHQITAHILTSAHQITCSLLLRSRHPHRGDLAEPKQPRQPLSITPISLDPIGRRPDLRRCRNNAADPHLGTRTRKPVPSRPRLVDDPHRRRQRLQPRHRRLATRAAPAATAPHRSPHRSHPRPPTEHAHPSPTQLPSPITGASRNSGSTAGPLPTATRANLRARRRALHTVWRRRGTACDARIEPVIVREQQADDYEAIRHVYAEAFRAAALSAAAEPWFRPTARSVCSRRCGRRATPFPSCRVTALTDGAVVGHVDGEPGDASPPTQLLPSGRSGSLPDHQGIGIGSARWTRFSPPRTAAGVPLIGLLGAPQYYSRFEVPSGATSWAS